MNSLCWQQKKINKKHEEKMRKGYDSILIMFIRYNLISKQKEAKCNDQAWFDKYRNNITYKTTTVDLRKNNLMNIFALRYTMYLRWVKFYLLHINRKNHVLLFYTLKVEDNKYLFESQFIFSKRVCFIIIY